jgi:hypothetical protein
MPATLLHFMPGEAFQFPADRFDSFEILDGPLWVTKCGQYEDRILHGGDSVLVTLGDEWVLYSVQGPTAVRVHWRTRTVLPVLPVFGRLR